MAKRYALIYLRSHLCELIVGSRGAHGVSFLDRASYPVDLVSQALARGTIKPSSVMALSKIVCEYADIAAADGVTEIDFLGTAALRQAENIDYVIDQLRVLTGGKTLKLFTREAEDDLSFKLMSLLSGGKVPRAKGAELLVSMNAETSTMALSEDGRITQTHCGQLGYLQMRELFRPIEAKSLRYERVVRDYIESRSPSVKHILRDRPIDGITVGTASAYRIAQLLKKSLDEHHSLMVREADFEKISHMLSQLGNGQIKKRYANLSEYQIQVLRHTIDIYLLLLRGTGLEALRLMQLNTAEGIVISHFNKTETKRLERWVSECTMASVKTMARRYDVDPVHAQAVESVGLRLFNVLKKQYLMTSQGALYLRFAAWLLDVGHFVGEAEVGRVCKRIIEDSDIIGLSPKDKKIVGMAIYGTRKEHFSSRDMDPSLSRSEKIIVAKIIALLKIAKALDKGRQQKIEKLRCHLDENGLLLTVTTSKDFQLEAYFFDEAKKTLKHVLGLDAHLKIKRVNL